MSCLIAVIVEFRGGGMRGPDVLIKMYLDPLRGGEAHGIGYKEGLTDLHEKRIFLLAAP